MKPVLRAILTCVVISVCSLTAKAAEPEIFRNIITQQIEAFARDDGTAAFEFASPGIREKFNNPQTFMTMVKSAYGAVYRPKSFRFGAVTNEYAGLPTQRVTIIDQQGRLWTALYAFERQPDGSWKIAGVTFVMPKEAVS